MGFQRARRRARLSGGFGGWAQDGRRAAESAASPEACRGILRVGEQATKAAVSWQIWHVRVVAGAAAGSGQQLEVGVHSNWGRRGVGMRGKSGCSAVIVEMAAREWLWSASRSAAYRLLCSESGCNGTRGCWGCACAGRCVCGGGMGRCIRRRCAQRASSAAKGSRSPAHAHARVRWRADGGGASLAHSRPRCRPVGCRERRGISVLPAGLPDGRRAGLSSGLRILLSTSRRARCTGSAGACAGRLRGALTGSSVCASAVAAAACRRTPRMAQLGPLSRCGEPRQHPCRIVPVGESLRTLGGVPRAPRRLYSEKNIG